MGRLRHVARVMVLLVAVAVLLAPARGQMHGDPSPPSFEEIVARLQATNTGLTSFTAEQIVDVRIWFLRFRIVAAVYAARPARYRIIVEEAPWIMRALGTVFQHVGAPEDLLALYQPATIEYEEDGGRRALRVTVTRKDPAANPPAGEMVIDPARWLVSSMRLRYDWGDVSAAYVYGRFEEYWLPVRVPIRVPRYGIEAVATFQNYRLNVPIPEGIFSSGVR